jgi:hypothetical protein
VGTLQNQVADAKEDDAKRSSKQREAVASYQQDYQVDRLVCMCTSKMLLLPAGSAGVSVCCGHFLLVICGKRAFPAPHRDYCNFNFAVIFKKNRFFFVFAFSGPYTGGDCSFLKILPNLESPACGRRHERHRRVSFKISGRRAGFLCLFRIVPYFSRFGSFSIAMN